MNIGGFQPFSLSDFPGKSSAILFTRGCNFQCSYCHNKELWPEDKPSLIDESDLLAFLEKRKTVLGGLVITGGEPTVQGDLFDFITKIKRTGLSIKLDTNGSRPDVLLPIIENELVDYIAMDIKAPLTKYSEVCGCQVNSELIQESIKIIASSKLSHHFRTTNFTDQLTEEDLGIILSLVPEGSSHIVQKYKKPAL